MRPSLRRLLVLATLGGLLWWSQRWWRLRTAPPGSSSDNPRTPATPWPPVPTDHAPTDPGRLTPEAAAAKGAHTASLEGVLEVSATLWSTTVGAALGGTEPVDGMCPEGFPVKAKARSRIYHLPGMAAYDRTTPDRCYRSAEDAARDGFRQAKH